MIVFLPSAPPGDVATSHLFLRGGSEHVLKFPLSGLAQGVATTGAAAAGGISGAGSAGRAISGAPAGSSVAGSIAGKKISGEVD